MLKKSDPDVIQSYLEDNSGLTGGHAEFVAIPESESEISDFLKSSNSPVTPSAGGTGVTGARIPFGGAALSLEKLNKIIEIKKEPDGGGYAVLQPGVILENLELALDKEGLLYPPDPTEKTAFIGGNVATNASGGRGFKYGTTRDYIRRLRIVLSTGEVLDIKRGKIFADGKFEIELPERGWTCFPIPKYVMPKVKNAAGYYSKRGMDFIDLFIGQEGTLGVVVEIEVRLLQKPEGTFDYIAFFSRDEDALRFASEARKTRAKGVKAASLEYLDFNSLEFICEKYSNIPKDARAAIFFEQEVTAETEGLLMESWSELLEKHHASLENVWFATDEKKKKEFYDLRHSIPEKVNEIIKRTGFSKVGTDLAVPYENFKEMMRFYRQKLEPSGIKYIIFGHIGESHMHVNILPKSKEEFEKAKLIYVELVKKALSLGGTVSAEHGIGKLKHRYLEMMYGKEGLLEMAALKKALDPKCILGLGNIFPIELLRGT